MSEQSDALNRTVRDKGIPLSDGPMPPLRLVADGEEERPELPMVALPRDGVILNHFAKEVGAIVSQNGVFRREAIPVTINRETGYIEDIDAVRFQSYVEDQMFCYIKNGSTRWLPLQTTMSQSEASGCLRSDAFRYQQRRLQRVNAVRLPVIRKDGRLELLPEGYDAETEIYTMRSGLDYDDTLTLEQAALWLESFLAEFPFENPRSLAVHVTAMLSVFGQSLMPMGTKGLNFVYRANMPRSGKGLLVQTAIVGPCGPAMIQSIPDSKEEFKKILDTEALNGSSYIFFDEIERRLSNRTLNSFLTTNLWTGRLMNSQKKFSVPQNSIVFMTGNNIDLSPDLAGRCLLVDLYVPEADVQSRHVENPIDALYLARADVRRDILSALWALVRAWDKGTAGGPARPGATAVFRGFETFSRIFGGIVEFAGFGSPMQSTAAEVDPDFADMRAVVEKLSAGVTKRAEYEFQDIIDVCRELNAFEWYLEGKMVKSKVDGEDVERFELNQGKKSMFGKLFSEQYGGTVFALGDGRTVRFGKRGKNRQRRYTVEVLNRDEPSTPTS